MGTLLVKDINPAGVSSSPGGFFVDSPYIYFKADDGIHGRELWITDGTDTGTRMVADILSGHYSSDPSDFIAVNDKVFFSAYHGAQRLWATDGTLAGTYLVKDVFPRLGAYSWAPRAIAYNDMLLFAGSDTILSGELWRSDGTDSGTALIKDIYSGATSSIPENFAVFNGKVFFSAKDSLHGIELWSTDGTASGTLLFMDINSDPGQSSYPSNLTVIDNKLFFTANDGINGAELWTSDGTIPGTRMSTDICSGSCSSTPLGFYQNGSTVFFSATETISGREPYALDLSSLKVEDLSSQHGIYIYPNPTTSSFTISIDEPLLGSTLSIYDITGKKMTAVQLESENSKLSTESFAKGIYVVTVTGKDHEWREKLVIE